MLAIIVGILLIGFFICACIPGLLGWTEQIVIVLKGAGPVLAALVGLIALFMGFADLQDKKEARKEELEAAKAAEEEQKKSQE